MGKTGLLAFFKRLFSAGSDKIVITDTPELTDSDMQALSMQAFAVATVIEQIANIVSKVEFKTYIDNREVKGKEWYSLNIRPNRNQTSTEFWQELIFRLLYHNEALVLQVGEQKIIADSFYKDDRAVIDCTFSQISRGTLNFSGYYKASGVYYFRYSNFGAQCLLSDIYSRYGKLAAAAEDKYLKSGGQKGVLNIPASAVGSQGFEEKFNELANKRLKKFNEERNAVLPLFNGMTYQSVAGEGSKKSSSEIGEIETIFDAAVTRAAQVYKYPPQLVRGEVSGINDAIDYMLTVCIDPLVNAISEELTGKQFSAEEVARGCRIEADTTCIKHIDIFDASSGIDKVIASGFASVNEAREKAGMTRIDEEWADTHYITKNYTETQTAGEGEENA